MRETEYNGGRFGCFTAGDVKRSRSREQNIKCVEMPRERFFIANYTPGRGKIVPRNLTNLNN